MSDVVHYIVPCGVDDRAHGVTHHGDMTCRQPCVLCQRSHWHAGLKAKYRGTTSAPEVTCRACVGLMPLAVLGELTRDDA